MGDDHVLAAQNVGRPHQNGIAQAEGSRQRFFFGMDDRSFRAGDAQFFKQGVKAAPVLGLIDAVRLRTHDGHLIVAQHLGQLDSCLTAEGHDDPHRILGPDNVHDVFIRQRFEIQAVGRVKVGGNGFGVIVDDNDLIAGFLQGPDAVDAGIVELDALSDADGAGSEYHDDRFTAFMFINKGNCFIGPPVHAVKVRRFRREFGRAGIDHLINGLLMGPSAPGNDLVGEAEDFKLMIKLLVDRPLLHSVGQLADVY